MPEDRITSDPAFSPSGLGRRQFLQAAAAGGLMLGAGGGLAACGGSSGPSPGGQAAGAGGKPVRGGTLKVAITGGSTSDTMDPNNAYNTPDWVRVPTVYEQLANINAQGQVQLQLAEEITPNAKATEWTVRVRKGVTFHNGKELTADDVIFTFARILNPKALAEGWTLINSIDVAGMKKLDKYTCTIPCKTPFATFKDTIACWNFAIVPSQGFDPKVPSGMIGTGAFKVSSFKPGVQSVFVANKDYWITGLPYAEQVVITDYTDETAQINALLAGQVNMIGQLSADGAAQVAQQGQSNIVYSPGGAFQPFTMRVDLAPFKDNRVRQALRLVIDRQQMLDVVFRGRGTVGNDIFGIWSPSYDHSIPQRVQDIDKAKSLLKAAGHADLTVELITGDIQGGVTAAAQVFVQQAASAGVTVNIHKVTPNQFFAAHNYTNWPFAQDWWFYNFYLPQVALTTMPGAPGNETHWSNPRYVSLYKQAIAQPKEQLRHEIEHEMQMIDYNEGGLIVPYFQPVIDATAANVHGVVPSKTGGSFNSHMGASDYKYFWIS
jgi:peptide/nickel transport system substrate-binding protein